MTLGLKSKKTEYEKDTVGVVSVITGNEVAKLTMLDEGKTFKNGKRDIKVSLKDLPKTPKLKPNNKTPIQLRVRMNEDDTEVKTFGPVIGLHKAKLVDLGKRDNEDADPIPYEKFFNKGQENENSHLEFFAVYRITEGMFKGVESAYYLHYKFEKDEEEPELTSFSFNTENPKATRGQQLLEWGYVHGGGNPGIWGEPIPWDEVTILPELLDRVLEADVEVGLVFDKGYIKMVQPLDVYAEPDEDDGYISEDVDEVDEEFPPVKAPKKAETRKPIRKSKKAEEDGDDDL